MMELSIYTRFSTIGASSRYRFYFYLRYLLKNGVNFEVETFFSTHYLTKRYSNQKVSSLSIVFAYWKRFFSLLNSSSNLLIEYELFPKIPYGLERLFLRKRRYVLNFDDDVWSNYRHSTLLRNKYDKLVRHASGVIVANEYLYQKVSALNSSVIKIPTVVDLDDYDDRDYEKFTTPTVVWIGTPYTYKYIEAFSEAFQSLALRMEYRLLVVAKKSLEDRRIKGVSMEFVDWSTEKEVEMLKRSHLGVMPLLEDGFSQGKSAFKLIQYCAAGIPSVASAIGENKNVIRDKIDGYVTHDVHEFCERVYQLFHNKSLYDKMAESALKRARDFSIQKYHGVFEEFIDKSFKASY